MAGKKGRTIPDQVYRALLARSGNKCAYPGCTHPIVNQKNEYVVQLCHIESVSHKKQRYNPNLTQAELNGYNNLLFMCLKHHIETNDEQVYTVDIMREIKYNHESNYVISPFTINMEHVYAIKKENEKFWEKVEYANNNEHEFPELKVNINTRANFDELGMDANNAINSIETLLQALDENDKDKYWEIFNLGFPNNLNKVRIAIDHMTIKYLEIYISQNPHDLKVKEKLDSLRKDFLQTSKTSTHVD